MSSVSNWANADQSFVSSNRQYRALAWIRSQYEALAPVGRCGGYACGLHFTAKSSRSSRRTKLLESHRPLSTASIHSVLSSSRPSTIRASRRASARADTKVGTFSECQVALALRAVDLEFVGCVELIRVTVGRSPEQQQSGSCGQLNAAEGGVV